MWVDKYKPKSTAELIGQARNIARIKSWLKTFEPSQSRPLFLYGPPGIGKTTAAHLCCKEVGYTTVEFNASDQRNKNIIKDVINVLAGNSRLNFFGRASDTKDAIILDEVDGMAGNEDRGGIAQLIIELQRTKKPMIFVCNDGQHQKLRSLKDKCEVIEFKRPDYEAIKAVVSKISKQEGLRVDKIDIKQLAESSDFDIRQVINSLSLFRDGNVEKLVKTTRLNAFEATKRVFTTSHPPLSLNDRFDCFFADYNIMPLFIFENYTKNQPTKGDFLRAVSRSADAQCFGDLVDKEIRTNQNWSLLNTQALFSTVIPSNLTESRNVGHTAFPQFLGKLSNTNKRARLTQELNAHMCLSLRSGLDPDCLEVMRDRLSVPLIKKDAGGIDAVIDFMHEYSLLREDFNSIMELSSWSFKPDPMSKVDTKTKTAFTNAYKKRSIAMPYFVDENISKKRKTAFSTESGDEDEVDKDDDDEPIIKPKKKTSTKSSTKKPQVDKKTSDQKVASVADEEQSKPASKSKKEVEKDKSTKQRNSKTNGKAKQGANTTIDIISSDEDTQPLESETIPKATANGSNGSNTKKTTGKPDKRPPAPEGGGIARFFSVAKRQKSS